MDQYKAWIQDTFTPLVAVAATPAAEAICTSKNGLTFVDILRPFSSVTRVDSQVRVGDELIKLSDFRMRFHDLATITQPQPEVVETHLHHVLTTSSAKYATMEARNDLARVIHTGTGLHPSSLSELSPWFTEYTQEFLRLTGWTDNQTLDHPVAAILVAPAEVPSPLQYFEALLTQVQLPPLMQSEVMAPLKDREFPRYYVLLQDGANTLIDERKVADNLSVLQRTFGPASVCLLKINTGTGERGSQGMPPEFFKRHMSATVPGGGAGEPAVRPPPPAQGLGACLTAADLDAVAACVRHFTTQLLLPRLEERVAKLNMAVTATRKGLRNQIRRMWKGVVDEANADKPYQWHSVESQLRQLADLAFVLGAYSFANETYHLAGLDYMAHGNNRWYAGAEEMRALAVIMAPNDNDPQKYFARAFEHYTKLPHRAGRLLATRVVLMSARFQQAAGRYAAASAMLYKPHHDEENARAGVLLEQSAYCLLFTSPPSVRKFAFHMVLAALRYNGGQFKRLALHCYKQVLEVYLGRGWNSIEQHLHALCAGLTMEAGDEVSAAQHFLSLLQGPTGPRQTAQNQGFQLKMFLDLTLKGTTKALEPGQRPLVPHLSLPLINTQAIRVLYADTSCFANAAAASCPTAVWTPLEVACSGDVTVIRDTLTQAMKQQNPEHEEYNLMAAGESVGVTVTLRNRLGVPLKAAQLRLVCEFAPLDDSQAPLAQPLLAAPGSTWFPQRQVQDSDLDMDAPSISSGGVSPLSGTHHPLAASGGSTPTWSQANTNSQYLHQQVLSLTLHPGETVNEVLSVTPLAAGWLRVQGVSWLLNNSVEGYQVFEPKGRKRKHPKGPRPSQHKHYPPWRRLLFKVVPSMCCIQLVHDVLPAQLFTGEVRKVVMRVRNTGTLPCRNLQLAISHPEVVCTSTVIHPPGQDMAGGPGQQDAAGAETDLCVSPLRLPVSQQVPGLSVYRPHAAECELSPGATQDWTLWIHPRSVGTLLFHMVWYCEPVTPQGSPASVFRYRTLRLTHSATVSPVVVARAHVGPLPADLSAQALRLQLDTPQSSGSVSINQITATTKGLVGGWKITTDLIRPSHTQQPTPAGDTPSSAGAGSNTLTPHITLLPTEPANLQLILLPPPVTAQQSPTTVSHSDTSDPASPQAAEPAVLDCSGTLPQGLMTHWYAQGLTPALPPRSKTVSEATLQAAASTTPAVQPPGNPLHSDPQVDLALLWRVHSGVVGASSSGTPERLGVLMLSDLTVVGRPPSQPLRCRLQLSRPVPSGCVLHDFRASPLCMVDLVLAVRNCTGRSVQLELQVGDDSSASSSQHAWAMALAVSAPGLTGAAGGASVPGTSSRDSAPGGVTGSGSVLSCQAGLQPGADYMWCGRTRVGLAQLLPGMCQEVPLRVAVFKPGTYAVMGCKVVSISAGSLQKTAVNVEPLLLRIDMASH